MTFRTTRLAASLMVITVLPASLHASGNAGPLDLASIGGAAAPAAAPIAAALAGMSLHQRLGYRAAAKLAAIAADNEHRMRTCRDDGKALATGVFYGNEYALALQEKKETPRFNYLRDRGAFYHGFAPRAFFEPVPCPKSASGFGACDFRLKPGQSPSAAIRSIGPRLALMDCSSTVDLAYCAALLEELGDEKFDVLFGSQATLPLRINFLQVGNPIVPLVRLVPEQDPTARGQIASYDGIPQYALKHLNGEGGRFNVIIADAEDPGRERFVGLGLPNAGVDHEGLVQVFVDEYNAPPIGWDIFTDPLARAIKRTYPPFYLGAVEEMADDTLDRAGFQERGGIRLARRHEFRAERVQALIHATPEEGLALLAAWQKETPGLL